MSLHLRKMMQDQIELAQSKADFSSPDRYEEWLLEAMLTNSDETLGALTVICADLLEQVRRCDPAYGLNPIPLRAVETHDKHAPYEFPSLCEYCRQETEPSDETVDSIMNGPE